ncbi:calcitonin gene-related peptide-receptor component protein [Grosmannia clavigera kw1407]|uniref:DNA-directed RNA polymerase III subunit RPC9 n=1 Tax=Grosmannia clavigera (strain kw1407 / UAMH 11150) TaxID=655863 RepID=F0XDE1_GROCL|nr:calcitonin gene-related peptide-receptor component protein [Grosmannia clavigera kw1407]EFX03699.1 calcitonin gene-related peptide-receptor component protein [Grosmannia clavigera kw1407]
MKVLEAQNAILTNYEVCHFLAKRSERQGREKHGRRRGANNNFETLVQEVLQYLRAPPGPLSQQPTQYSAEAIGRVVERLRGYDLAKGELVMLINMRPQTPAQLHACIEEVEGRLSEDQQSEVLDVVAEVLGQFPVQDEADEADDPTA